MILEDVIEADFVEDLKEKTVIGIDIGSRTGKAILLHEGKIFTSIIPTGISMQRTAQQLLDELVDKSQVAINQVEYIIGTGYGRISIKFDKIPTEVITEISCHAMGAHYLNKGTKTIIDIGGQDSKAIKIDHHTGKVIEFIMNDKCAAGSGRFLEKVAGLLNYRIDEFGRASLESKKKLEVSSQCVVFSESEVISLKVKGEKREDIAAAINVAIAKRVRNLVNKLGVEPELIFSGGVSNNPGMRKALEEVVGFPITDTKLDMIYNGALGAAIYAVNYSKNLQERVG